MRNETKIIQIKGKRGTGRTTTMLKLAWDDQRNGMATLFISPHTHPDFVRHDVFPNYNTRRALPQLMSYLRIKAENGGLNSCYIDLSNDPNYNGITDYEAKVMVDAASEAVRTASGVLYITVKS